MEVPMGFWRRMLLLLRGKSRQAMKEIV
jgi:hypothetical protein